MPVSSFDVTIFRNFDLDELGEYVVLSSKVKRLIDANSCPIFLYHHSWEMHMLMTWASVRKYLEPALDKAETIPTLNKENFVDAISKEMSNSDAFSMICHTLAFSFALDGLALMNGIEKNGHGYTKRFIKHLLANSTHLSMRSAIISGNVTEIKKAIPELHFAFQSAVEV